MGRSFQQTASAQPLRAHIARCLIVLGTFGTATAIADEPPTWVPGPVQQADPDLQDLEMTLQAREAIGKDPKLAPIDIFVSVRKRVATLRGTVPNSALIEQATACLQSVRGLTEIRNGLQSSAEEPSRNRLTLGPIQQRVPIADTPVVEPPRKQSMLVRRPRDDGWTPGPSPVWQPVRQEKNADSTELLQASVENIRMSDRRFRRLSVKLNNGMASIEGNAVSWEHAAEFARRIARLSGIKRVVIGDVGNEMDH